MPEGLRRVRTADATAASVRQREHAAGGGGAGGAYRCAVLVRAPALVPGARAAVLYPHTCRVV